MKPVEFLRLRMAQLGLSQSGLATRLTLRGHSITKGGVGHWLTERTEMPLRDEQFRLTLASVLEIDVNQMMREMGYVLTEDDRSEKARLAADIIDQLPSDAQELAIDYLKILERRYSREN